MISCPLHQKKTNKKTKTLYRSLLHKNSNILPCSFHIDQVNLKFMSRKSLQILPSILGLGQGEIPVKNRLQQESRVSGVEQTSSSQSQHQTWPGFPLKFAAWWFCHLMILGKTLYLCTSASSLVKCPFHLSVISWGHVYDEKAVGIFRRGVYENAWSSCCCLIFPLIMFFT